MNTHDIAKRAGVSVGTVSNVVNGKSSVKSPTRERVLKAMEEAGWQPNQLARGLRRPSTNFVVMFLPDISNPFFPSVVKGAEDVMAKNGYRIVLCNTDNDPSRECDTIVETRSFNPAGYLLIPSATTKLLAVLRTMNKPAVFVDRCPDEWDGDFVSTDNEEGGAIATTYLIEAGHTNIAMITGPLRSNNAKARLAGFRRAMREHKLKLNKAFIRQAQFDSHSGAAATEHLLKSETRPSAIFASNDLIAAGCLAALRRAKMKCPRDISIIGFDDLDFAEVTEPPLTTVHQPAYDIGSTAAEVLLARIEDPKMKPRKVLLPTFLKIRGSVERQ